MTTALTYQEVMALPAGRLLDDLVAIEVMGWRSFAHGWYYDDKGEYGDSGAYDKEWKPSSNLAVAWRVVEHYNSPEMSSSRHLQFQGILLSSQISFMNAKDAALRICHAALLSLKDCEP